MSSLDDRLSTLAVSWAPDEGDTLVGTVIGFEERTSDYSEDTYPALTIEVTDNEVKSTEEGATIDPGSERVWYASQTSAKWAVRRQNVAVGDEIAVRYIGLGTAKPGKAAPKNFKLVVLERGGNTPPASAEEKPNLQGDTDDSIPF